MVSFSSFAEASAAASDGEKVGGVRAEDGPVYFLYPADADDDAISRCAFQAKHGRVMNQAEEILSGLDPAQGGVRLPSPREVLSEAMRMAR